MLFIATSSQASTAATTTEQMRLRKKPQNLNRSDSTGSSSGRKFLAPTLSDPQTLRTDKYQKKKSSNFMSTSGGGIVAGTSGSTPTGARPRNQILQPDHVRSKSQVLRPETTTESEEYEDTTGTSGPSTSAATGAIAKHALPPLPADTSNVHFHTTTSQSMHGFDLQMSSPYDGVGRSNNLNNNSSSTGSNIVSSTSKIAGNMGTSCSNTNVAYEVHDWWTDQVNVQSSDEEDDE